MKGGSVFQFLPLPLAEVFQLLSPTHMNETIGGSQACKQVCLQPRHILLEKQGRKYLSALSNYKVCDWASLMVNLLCAFIASRRQMIHRRYSI